MTDRRPMLALLQLRVSELPVVLELLADVALLTLFVGPFALPLDEPNGSNWCLRTYSSLEGLIPLPEPTPARAGDSELRKADVLTYRPFPLRWEEVDDWPTRDHVPLELRTAWAAAREADEDTLPHNYGSKVGGWPSTVQSQVEWREAGELLHDVDFVFQIASDEKTGFLVGNGGFLFIGRCRGTGSWTCSWQSP
jgi:Domain of unknown function (DUF1963)